MVAHLFASLHEPAVRFRPSLIQWRNLAAQVLLALADVMVNFGLVTQVVGNRAVNSL